MTTSRTSHGPRWRTVPNARRHTRIGGSRDKRRWELWTADDRAKVADPVGRANPDVIAKAFSRIATNFPQAAWLPEPHRVADDPWGTSKKALPFGEELDCDIADYAAASVPLHLGDAWTYFGRAMQAVSSGSIDVAQHLLYYCELRAMNALLFRHGVLLMGERNFVLTTSGIEKVPFPEGAGSLERNSHQSIWVLFTEWARTAGGASFCGDVVRFNGQPLQAWAAERPQPVDLTGAMGSLLKDWGVDIARFSSDRAVRNNSSYTPTRLRPTPTEVSPAYIADLLDQVWRLVAPVGDVAFQQFDPFIARIAFDSFARSETTGETTDSDSTDTGVGEEDEAEIVGSYVPGDRTATEFWVERVLGRSAGRFVPEFIDDHTKHPTPSVLVDASPDLSGESAARQFNGMVGRALILLRFATGATRDLIAAAGCSTTDVDFWIQDMLLLHGIRVPETSDYRDLWFDVEDAVDELGAVRDDTDGTNLAVLVEEQARQMQVLTGFERVPAWAAAPVPGEESDQVA